MGLSWNKHNLCPGPHIQPVGELLALYVLDALDFILKYIKIIKKEALSKPVVEKILHVLAAGV